MYDLDLFDTPAATVATLRGQGRRVTCYINAGSYEPGRPDSGSFPASVLGSGLEGWPGEKWLDVRQIDTLAPIMRSRLDLCRPGRPSSKSSTAAIPRATARRRTPPASWLCRSA
jgi:hypothetical protein